jgi:hypothetical protein
MAQIASIMLDTDSTKHEIGIDPAHFAHFLAVFTRLYFEGFSGTLKRAV